MIGRLSPAVIVAALFALAAGVWASIALAGALRIEVPGPRASPAVSPAAAAAQARARADSTPAASIARAIRVDPFRPERVPAPARYGSNASATSPGDSVTIPAQRQLLRLLGTVIDAEGSGASFAMCQLGDLPPRAVRVGERVGEYRLRAIRQGAADFVGPDGFVTLRVATPAP